MWWLAALATYAGILLLLALLNKREFRLSPEKGERYQRLPAHYKVGCWLVVVPLFVASIFLHAAIGLLAIVAFGVVEALCVRWYRRNGLLPPSG